MLKITTYIHFIYLGLRIFRNKGHSDSLVFIFLITVKYIMRGEQNMFKWLPIFIADVEIWAIQVANSVHRASGWSKWDAKSHLQAKKSEFNVLYAHKNKPAHYFTDDSVGIWTVKDGTSLNIHWVYAQKWYSCVLS